MAVSSYPKPHFIHLVLGESATNLILSSFPTNMIVLATLYIKFTVAATICSQCERLDFCEILLKVNYVQKEWKKITNGIYFVYKNGFWKIY